MRDLIVAGIVIGSLPSCYRRPFVGLLMFSVLAYMRLQDLAWGFARFERWSFYVAIVTFAGYVANKNKKPPVMEMRTQMMAILCVTVGLGLFFGKGETKIDFAPYIEFIKIIAIAVFTTALIRTKEHLRVMVWVIALCFGFYGVKNGIAAVVRLGRLHIIRGPGGMLADNNDFGLAMVMAVPMLLHLGLSERRKILRRGMLAMVPLTMITVMATHSRGAFLAMVVMMFVLIWRSRSRMLGFTIAGLLLAAGVAFAPASYFDRISTLREVEADGSAMGRIEAWKVAGRMIRSNPVFGVGFNRFKTNYLDYEPNPSTAQLQGGGTRVAHNSYLQVWAECGTPAFMLYMGLLFLSFFDIWSLRREAKRRYHSSWILSYCTMFETVLFTFMVGSLFLNRAHFDLIYHYEAIILVFGQIARLEMRDESSYPLRPGASMRGSLVAVEPRGFRRRPRGTRGFRNTPLTA
ncbi:MAG: putative O-glycosylation ligase, exosortase A system-associated [bacterium]|nr:putative O-glycosylation ligase, exosortase A system-associated [bacterium]